MPRAFDLFLSHNSKDKPAVHDIAVALRGRGIRVWLDEDELVPGRPWREALEEIIETAGAAAVLVGKDGLGPWEDRELSGCLNEFVDRGLPVIPVLLPGASAKPKLPLFLRTFTWVDFRAGITAEKLDRLVRGIPKPKRKRRPKPSPPGPPLLHNLPLAPLGEFLKGRDEELRELAEGLQGDGQPRAIIQSRALYGLGGIGKTRLAIEYAWQTGSCYRAAFFVRADSPESLRTGFAALARADLLDLPERAAADQDETVHAVLRWLKANPGWLLIFDNVDSKEAEGAVLAMLPTLVGGHVLITSRLREWPKTVHRQALDTISLEEARAFLLKRTEGERCAAADDHAQAGQLAEKLDGLPLALEQAGAYIGHLRFSFSDYLKVWEEEKGRVLEWYDEASMAYPASVAATWKTSFERLHPTAAALLRLAAFLAPEPIPVEMFEAEKELLEETVTLLVTETGQETDGGSAREAMAELESYSLISRQAASFTVHRVVQEVLQSRIPPERRREWIESSLKIVNGYSPANPSDARTWPVWNVLKSHTARIAKLADEAGVPDPTSRLMNELALYLKTRGLFAEAEPLMRRSLAIDEAAFGSDHPTVPTRLNNLAMLCLATNRLAEAESLMRRSLAIDEATLGNEDPDVAIRLSNLALVLQATNRLAEAEPMIRRSLAIDEAASGSDHPDVARDLNNLAQLLQATNRLAEAEPMMRRSLAIDEAAFGNDHPDVARDLNNLARLLKATNQLSEAEPMMRRAVGILERSLGQEHSNVAICLNNLAGLLLATNRLSEAEPLIRRAVEIFERSLGPDHPSTKRGRENLAELLAEIGGAAGK